MNLLEVLRILQSVGRRWKNPSENPLTLWQMTSFYAQRRLYLRRHPLPAIKIPFVFSFEAALALPRIAVVVHCYYPELMPEMLDHIQKIPFDYRLYVSTDTEEKRRELLGFINARQIPKAEVRLTQNRGRDIAPKYITFRDAYDDCDYFLHLHSKKSPHTGSWGDDWRRYLLHSLAGSPEIVRTNLRVLADKRIGLVFPVPLNDTTPALRWGTTFNVASRLARRLGVSIRPDYCFDYPDGSMFWGKPSAIRPLLDIGLCFEDFQPEKGQLDGEIHHAIERMVTVCAHKQGLSPCRVSTNDNPLRLTVPRDENSIPASISECIAAQERERLRHDKLVPK
jgi:lipopolysaccharide biosynthesis protein